MKRNEYNDYLLQNKDIINYIISNNIEDQIYDANKEALDLSNMEGKQFLHSYRYSKIYDVLTENNLDKSKVFKIVELIENNYNKDITEIVDDFYFKDTGISL